MYYKNKRNYQIRKYYKNSYSEDKKMRADIKYRYKNESDIIEIIFDNHFNNFRGPFLNEIKYEKRNIIDNEIANNLNPYRIFDEKEYEISNELIELSNKLQNYFGDIRIEFFVNYF
jgi:hypothetical protein